MLKLAFLASNSGSSMQAIVRAISTQRLRGEARLLVSNKDGTGAVAFARQNQIPATIIPTLPNAREADRLLHEALVSAGVDLIVLSGYLRKLGSLTLNAFAGRILNTHPALLPQFGGQGMYGRRVHEAVLAAGVSITGATVHLVDGEYDHGKIIAQTAISIPSGATAALIEELVMASEQSLLVDTLVQIQSGRLSLA